MSDRSNAAMLSFDPAFASLRDGLSVAQQIGDTLWVANDENHEPGASEKSRLLRPATSSIVMNTKSFQLLKYLDLPLPKQRRRDRYRGVGLCP